MASLTPTDHAMDCNDCSNYSMTPKVHDPEQQHNRKSSLLSQGSPLPMMSSQELISPLIDDGRIIEMLDCMLSGYPSMNIEPQSNDSIEYEKTQNTGY